MNTRKGLKGPLVCLIITDYQPLVLLSVLTESTFQKYRKTFTSISNIKHPLSIRSLRQPSKRLATIHLALLTILFTFSQPKRESHVVVVF